MANGVLSRLNVSGTIYDLKDADSRTKLATLLGDKAAKALGTAAFLDSVGTVAEGGTNLPTAGAVYTAIQTAVAGLAGAMHFVGKIEGDTFAAALAAFKVAHPEYTETAGDIVIWGVKEYVFDGTNWAELGDETIYETIAHAAATYVPMTRTVCGIDLTDDVTGNEMKEALGLKALAYRNSASGSITTADSVKNITVTPAGTVAVTLTQTSTAMTSTGSVTAEGTISGKVVPTGTVSMARDADNGTQINGDISVPIITVTPNEDTIQPIKTLGKLAQFTAAKYTAPSVAESKSQFATAGIVASIDETDSEMLVFSAADTSAALTGTGFNAGSYTPAEYTPAELPTLDTAKTFVTGIASATSSKPTFTGDKYSFTFTGNAEGDAITNGVFNGSAVTVSVSGNYDRASVESAEFTGTEATITPELVKTAKNITVG